MMQTITSTHKPLIFIVLMSAATLFAMREYGIERLTLQRNNASLQQNSLRSINSNRTDSAGMEMHSNRKEPQSTQQISASPNESSIEEVIHNPWRSVPDIQKAPNFTSKDIIHGHIQIFDAPIVNEEFKIIFFHMAKVGSSDWKRFFMRLSGMPKETWCLTNNIHKRGKNKLKFLDEFSVEEAQHMMTSPEWTRATFVRNPKSRILSAYLDKSIHNAHSFEIHECVSYGNNLGGSDEKVAKFHEDECIARHRDFGFFLHNTTKILTKNRHYRPIYSMIDEKWWPWMNFIGKMEYFKDDAESLLKAIKSERNGMTAWDRSGATGWSGMEREGICNGTRAFLDRSGNDSHATNAKEKMQQYYTPELENIVEEHFADDLDNPYFHFNDLDNLN